MLLRVQWPALLSWDLVSMLEQPYCLLNKLVSLLVRQIIALIRVPHTILYMVAFQGRMQTHLHHVGEHLRSLWSNALLPTSEDDMSICDVVWEHMIGLHRLHDAPR